MGLAKGVNEDICKTWETFKKTSLSSLIATHRVNLLNFELSTDTTLDSGSRPEFL